MITFAFITCTTIAIIAGLTALELDPIGEPDED
jgi:hypothetical protein